MSRPEIGQAIGFTAQCEFCYEFTPTNTMWEVPYDNGDPDPRAWWGVCAECHQQLFPDHPRYLEAK